MFIKKLPHTQIINLLSFSYPYTPATWLNFFKESFLFDFNYKVFFCSLVTAFIYSGAYNLNSNLINNTQLLGLLRLLFSVFRTAGTYASLGGIFWALSRIFMSLALVFLLYI